MPRLETANTQSQYVSPEQLAFHQIAGRFKPCWTLVGLCGSGSEVGVVGATAREGECSITVRLTWATGFPSNRRTVQAVLNPRWTLRKWSLWCHGLRRRMLNHNRSHINNRLSTKSPERSAAGAEPWLDSAEMETGCRASARLAHGGGLLSRSTTGQGSWLY